MCACSSYQMGGWTTGFLLSHHGKARKGGSNEGPVELRPYFLPEKNNQTVKLSRYGNFTTFLSDTKFCSVVTLSASQHGTPQGCLPTVGRRNHDWTKFGQQSFSFVLVLVTRGVN